MPARKYAHARYKPLDWNRREYISDRLPGSPDEVFHRKITQRWRRQAGRLPNSAKGHLIRPQPARDTDPVTIMLLLDGILRTNPDAKINSGNLTQHFTNRDEYQQIIWNPIVVGRLLSCIFDLSEGIPLPNGGPKMIGKSNNAGQLNYSISDDIHTWHWLGYLREHFGQLAEDTIAREIAEREPVKLTYDEVWLGSWSYRYGDAPKVPE